MDQEWLEWRRKGIGASDAPVIMGVSPFKTINQLWKEKVMGWQQPDNAAMARGRELEDEALGAFMMETGLFMTPQVRKEHAEHPWMRATLDGYEEKENLVVEIKTCRAVHEEVPEHYYPQLQHQMEVCGATSIFYYSYDGNRGKLLQIDKNPGYVEKMIDSEKKFWERIQEGFLDLSADEEFNAHLQKMAEIKLLKKELQEQESFHLSQLILFSDGCAAKGKGGMLFQGERKGSINYSSIPELSSVNLEEYRKPSSQYWSVRVEK